MLYLKQTIKVYDYVIVKQVFLLFFENDGRNEKKKRKNNRNLGILLDSGLKSQ